jgi:hypothetical protein
MRKLLKKKVRIFEKEISVFLILVISMIGLGSAALVPYFASLTGEVTVTQGLMVDGKNWESASFDYSESLTSLEKKQVTSGAHSLDNSASINAAVNIDSVCSGTDCAETNTIHDSVGLSTTLSWVAGSDVEATLSGNTVNLVASGAPTQSPWIASESRIRIDSIDSGIQKLSDLKNISWDVDVTSGYIAHVDVLIDTDSDGISDDALVFEYAKINPSVGCDEGIGSYPTGAGLNTFDDKGIVNGSAYAWLSSGAAGPGCVEAGGFYTSTLDGWIAGHVGNGKSIDGETPVIAIEIEVDGWIADSESEVSNILINGVPKVIETLPNPVVVETGESQIFYVNSEFPKMLTPDTYTITTTVNVA